jgi:Spy/CpxP family protein refolding chaperone
VIDRAALEQLRAQQMQRMDFISKRILAAVEDAADVLTPEQRLKFAEHLRARMH